MLRFALWVWMPSPTMLAAGVWTTYHRWIPAEEDHLARMFGTEYTTYQACAARWIGSPRTS